MPVAYSIREYYQLEENDILYSMQLEKQGVKIYCVWKYYRGI